MREQTHSVLAVTGDGEDASDDRSHRMVKHTEQITAGNLIEGVFREKKHVIFNGLIGAHLGGNEMRHGEVSEFCCDAPFASDVN